MRRLLQLCIVFILGGGGPGLAVEIAGPARVVDGDTLEIGGQTIRFHGIDAPEGAQTCQDAYGRAWDCGDAATHRLTHLTRGGVRCRGTERDRYDRLVAVCFTPQGANINAALVREGYAWAYRRYSRQFVPEENVARQRGVGVWTGANVPPWEFRRGARIQGQSQAASGPRSGCTIKGNISGSGRIYHLPGSRTYARTRIDESKGERWFCSESQARAAGWRPPRG